MDTEVTELWEKFKEDGFDVHFPHTRDSINTNNDKQIIVNHARRLYVKAARNSNILEKDAVHQLIQSTKRKLLEDDDLNDKEALVQAFKKRKVDVQKSDFSILEEGRELRI